MKPILLLLNVLVLVLAGCGPAARTVANQGDDVVRLIGDDVARVITVYGDEIAHTSQQYADDVGHTTQYSDEFVRYWDNVVISTQRYDDPALVLLYREETLSPLQAGFVQRLREGTVLTDEEARLYLQTVCAVADYVEYYNEYPKISAAQFYAQQVAEENGILILSIVDFGESAYDYAVWLIQRNGAEPQSGAKLVSDGLCLVSDFLEK